MSVAQKVRPAEQPTRLDERGSPPVSRVKALVLLSGAAGQGSYSARLKMSLLDLPLSATTTILGQWACVADELQAIDGSGAIRTRLLMAHGSLPPATKPGPSIRIEPDPVELRGTGGVLADLSRSYHPDDYLFVSTAAQVVVRPVIDMLRQLLLKPADVSVVWHPDGTPSGLALARCRALQTLPGKGYIDFKEQALPLLARKFEFHAVKCDAPFTLPVRSLKEYIAALKRLYDFPSASSAANQVQPEEWRSSFKIVMAQNEVHPQATIHDSVVLPGAHVGSGAVVVRSVIARGATVRSGQIVVDQLVAPQPTGGRNGS